MSDDLVKFLRARLDEDEHMCRFAMWDGEGPWTEVSSGVLQTAGDLYPTGNQGISRYAVHFQPERMLREVEAKRQMIPFLVEAVSGHVYGAKTCLVLMTRAYAEHPDYRTKWAD